MNWFLTISGTILAIGIVDVIGRKYTLVTLLLIYSASVVALSACFVGKGYLLTFLFVARGISSGMFQVVYVYTPEVYPTNLRAAAMGAGSSFARIGGAMQSSNLNDTQIISKFRISSCWVLFSALYLKYEVQLKNNLN